MSQVHFLRFIQGVHLVVWERRFFVFFWIVCWVMLCFLRFYMVIIFIFNLNLVFLYCIEVMLVFCLFIRVVVKVIVHGVMIVLHVADIHVSYAITVHRMSKIKGSVGHSIRVRVGGAVGRCV